MSGKQSKAAMHAAALRVIERMDSDITPEEIARRAAEIRAEWSPEQLHSRLVGANRSEYTIPMCRLDMMPHGIGKVKER